MPLYESVFIARQDIPAQEVEALSERFQGIIAEQGGEVARREYWGLKNLAYRIKKNRKGHYTMFQMDAPAAAIQEMERNMRISEDVLRYMTVRIEAFDDEPSAMMQTRSAREERRREERRARAAAEAREKSAAEAREKAAGESGEKAAGEASDDAKDKAGDDVKDKAEEK